ncbi:MAG TPA: ABC transporter substrate-binding protein [Thermoleophilaceae bacterium]|jgi:multiple sugar transport system substrate-binding protein|nr:ABC transporter substrate-binding protein [Thermoleophilaceae bacterium]
MSWRWAASFCCVVGLALAGCGGDDEESGDAKKAPAADSGKASGTVSWCIGKDTSGAYGTAIDLFQKQNSKVKVKLVELPESADEQRTQLVQRLRAESDECDVVGMDVIWTAEFAAQDWLAETTDIISKRESDFIPATLETAKFEDKYWAVPYHTNAGFLYYRKDQVPEPPSTWEDVFTQAQEQDGLVYQGFRYEGLTVNFLELLYSAGGTVLSEDGQSVEVDSPEAEKALSFMVEGFQNGATPKAVTTYKEEEARRAFESGKATFMRNWPYAYALGKESKIADKFEIGTFPSFEGGEPASVLGGFNLAISAFAKNPEGAAAFIDFATSEEVQKANFLDSASPPAFAAVYDDPEVQEKYAFAADLKKAVEQGQARPVSPVYPQISEAIFNNVHDALQGKVEPKAALKTMSGDIEKALETF